MKTCTNCKKSKQEDEFYKRKLSKDGLRGQCKVCRYEYTKSNINIINGKRNYYIKNREQISLKKKNARKNNPIYYSEQDKKVYQKNRDKKLLSCKIYRHKNKDKRNDYERKRKQSDHLYKMICNLRKRTSTIFSRIGYKKTCKTEATLGIDYLTSKKHIEHKFKAGMSWDNYGEWEIDHIIPLSSARTKIELIPLFHYTNLQPLWAEENNKKNNKIVETQIKIPI